MWNNALRLLDTVSDGSAGGLVPAENIDKMWATLITGLIVVFLILVILVAFLWAMGKLLNLNIKRKPKAAKAAHASKPAASPSAPAPAPAAPAPDVPEEYYDEDDSEIIAVIAAAIAAYGETEGKQYRIASVRKRDRSQRSNWSAAGISENTRPF